MKRLRITVEGIAYDVTVEDLDSPAPAAPAPSRPVSAQPAAAPMVTPVAAPAAPAAPAGPGTVPSPLAGTVISVEVTAGQKVTAGDTLLVLEAMKMNTTVGAPKDGTVASVEVAAGATVTEGQPLVTLS